MSSKIPGTGTLALLALLLSACGGSSSSSRPLTSAPTPTPTPTPTPAPTPTPVFTSTDTVTLQGSENSYVANAFDPLGRAVTYAITGGADAGRATFVSDGRVGINRSLADADGDNIYEVEIGAVVDGVAQTKMTVRFAVTATPPAAPTQLIASGLTGVNYLLPARGTVVFAPQRTGRILLLDTATGAIAATPFLDVTSEISTDGHRGMLGFAPAPDFATSGVAYVALTNVAGELELRRYRTFVADRNRLDPSTGDLILKVPGAPAYYAAGWIGFGPDGLLWLTTGSGSTPNVDVQSLTGKVLRLDVGRDDYPADPDRDYGIPATNPNLGGRPEIFALGFASPRSATIDPVSGYVVVSDYGPIYATTSAGVPTHGEEADLIRPLWDAGRDYSVTSTQGSFAVPACLSVPNQGEKYGPIYCEGPSNSVYLTPPDTGNLILGPVYRGPLAIYQGRVLFGLEEGATARSMPDPRNLRSGFRAPLRNTPFANVGSVSGFGLDSAGSLYAITPTGQVYRITG